MKEPLKGSARPTLQEFNSPANLNRMVESDSPWRMERFHEPFNAPRIAGIHGDA